MLATTVADAAVTLGVMAGTGFDLAALDHDGQEEDPRYPGWLTPVMLSYWFAAPAADAGSYARGMEPRTRRPVLAGRAVQRVRPPTGKDRDRLRAALAPFFDRHDVRPGPGPLPATAAA